MSHGNPEPSLGNAEEGVETGWQVSKRLDKGTVQTTNTKEAAKAVVVSITCWSKVQFLPPPPRN